MQTFTMHLVTPEVTFFSGDVTLVEAPGTLGEFGVLAGHMNFISTLKAGVIRIHTQDAGVSSIFVSGGVAEVNPTSCTILAENLTDLAKITPAEATQRLEKARVAVETAPDEAAREDAKRLHEIEDALVAAVTS